MEFQVLNLKKKAPGKEITALSKLFPQHIKYLNSLSLSAGTKHLTIKQ